MFVVAVVLLFTLLTLLWLRRLIPNDAYGLDTTRLALAFSFKILMGCAYGYIFFVKYDGDDTWWLHDFALKQTVLLKTDPARFFSEMNPVLTFGNDKGFAENGYYYLAYLETWILTKPIALFNLLSGGNYYINLVFFNLPVFFGHYWLYRSIRQKFDAPAWPVYIAVFLVPPVVFWLSGLRADGILFFLVMLAFRQFEKLLTRPAVKTMLLFVVALAGILIFRSVVLVVLLPALLSWLIIDKTNKNPLKVFMAVYSTGIALFLGSTFVSPDKNAASVIVGRQRAFFELVGNTRFNLDTLRPDAVSFVSTLPQALNNTFLRPYPWEATGALQYATVLETCLFLTLLALFVFRRSPRWALIVNHPFSLSLIFFGIFLYVLTGYIVPFPGAIVRYKIIGEVFFFSLMAAGIQWRSFHQDTLKKNNI